MRKIVKPRFKFLHPTDLVQYDKWQECKNTMRTLTRLIRIHAFPEAVNIWCPYLAIINSDNFNAGIIASDE